MYARASQDGKLVFSCFPAPTDTTAAHELEEASAGEEGGKGTMAGNSHGGRDDMVEPGSPPSVELNDLCKEPEAMHWNSVNSEEGAADEAEARQKPRIKEKPEARSQKGSRGKLAVEAGSEQVSTPSRPTKTPRRKTKKLKEVVDDTDETTTASIIVV